MRVGVYLGPDLALLGRGWPMRVWALPVLSLSGEHCLGFPQNPLDESSEADPTRAQSLLCGLMAQTFQDTQQYTRGLGASETPWADLGLMQMQGLIFLSSGRWSQSS